MSDRAESTKSKALAPVEVARLLRELAEKLEKGTLRVGADGVVPADAIKVELSGKSKEGSASLSLKCRWKYGREEGADPAPKQESARPDGIPSYKKIKKRMGSTLKKIRADLVECRLPDAELVDSFDQDAELMLHYPKKGEWADIVAFRELSAAFAKAAKKGDLEAVARQVEALRASEKSCHKRYK